jgi:hypothetical protein
MTAVEWLFIELYEKFEMKGDGREMNKVLEQAKSMEKEQIKNAIIHNQNGLLRRKTVLEAEQYYNETYKQ